MSDLSGSALGADRATYQGSGPGTAGNEKFRGFARRIRRQKLMLIGLGTFLVITILVLFPSFFATHDPLSIDTSHIHVAPSRDHFFGTDDLGRDIFSRVIFGMRLTFTAGFSVVLGSLLLGSTIGMLAGYYGGFLDELVMRSADMFLAFPGLVMALAIVAVLGPSLGNAMLALIMIWWPQYARLARGLVLTTKHNDYIGAAKAVGVRSPRILSRHILPNIISTIFIKGTLDVGHAILLTSGLSFLGLGALPPDPELGSMVTSARFYLLTAWWASTFPGLIIFIGVLATNLVGDGLRDILDPTLKDSGWA